MSDKAAARRPAQVPSHPGVARSHRRSRISPPRQLPGANQYVVQNFTAGSMNTGGLTGSMTCDTQFAAGGCSAVQGDAQSEGILLTGPASSTDQATSWTVTITWTAVSLG